MCVIVCVRWGVRVKGRSDGMGDGLDGCTWNRRSRNRRLAQRR